MGPRFRKDDKIEVICVNLRNLRFSPVLMLPLNCRVRFPKIPREFSPTTRGKEKT